MRGWACKAHIAGLLVPLPAFGGATLTCASPVKGEGVYCGTVPLGTSSARRAGPALSASGFLSGP